MDNLKLTEGAMSVLDGCVVAIDNLEKTIAKLQDKISVICRASPDAPTPETGIKHENISSLHTIASECYQKINQITTRMKRIISSIDL